MGHAWGLLASWSIPGLWHYGCFPPGPKAMAASELIYERVGQGDQDDCTKPLQPQHITHQSSFPFENALFEAWQRSWLVCLKTKGWHYLCSLWNLLSKVCFLILFLCISYSQILFLTQLVCIRQSPVVWSGIIFYWHLYCGIKQKGYWNYSTEEKKWHMHCWIKSWLRC